MQTFYTHLAILKSIMLRHIVIPAPVKTWGIYGVLIVSLGGMGISSTEAQSDGTAGAISLLPEQISYMPGPPNGTRSAQVSILAGPLNQPVVYTQRVYLQGQGQIDPHTHPDTRQVTVLSGELYAGIGAVVSWEGVKRYPAGSFFTVPAGTVHFVGAVNGPVLYQETGYGPTRTDFLKP